MIQKKRRALVTGGTRGIGAAIANKLLGNNISVMVTGTKESSTLPAQCEFYAVDFRDLAATESFAKDVSKMDIDILINNAGINKIGAFADLSMDDFDSILRVNLRTPFLLCRAVLPGMKQKRWGRIVNISSIFGKISKEFRAPYSASKFGLDGMTAALAAEVAADGILANCVSPGFIDTELTRSILGKTGISELVSRVPIKRLGNVEEIAEFVCWLAGAENSYISGQNVAIDGGFVRV